MASPLATAFESRQIDHPIRRAPEMMFRMCSRRQAPFRRRLQEVPVAKSNTALVCFCDRSPIVVSYTFFEASPESLYMAFKAAPVGRFTGMAEACLRFAQDPDPEREQIAEKAITALKRIANESRINKLRISNKFGLSPDV